jgi:hypothetical protein
MNRTVDAHCRELERCNQRGGRMLSVLDLLDVQTLELDLAAWLMARLSRGASLMVGARPGGAGKTTVMCALINLWPCDVELTSATASVVRAAGAHSSDGRRGYICHEIGDGPYYAYLWGAELRAYCALADAGHLLATNLHADDLDEARDQVCAENRVPEKHFNAFHLAAFLRMEGGAWSARRRVEKVYESDGASPHRLVFDVHSGRRPVAANGEDNARISECRHFLEVQQKGTARTIEDVRAAVVAFFGQRA